MRSRARLGAVLLAIVIVTIARLQTDAVAPQSHTRALGLSSRSGSCTAVAHSRLWTGPPAVAPGPLNRSPVAVPCSFPCSAPLPSPLSLPLSLSLLLSLLFPLSLS
eukprot:1284254-Pleurochrysis_carterae.AAC.1